jgi:hypothetical protein
MSNRYREKGASLVDALLHYKGASEADALPTNVARSSDLAGSVGRHHPWCPSLHRGRQEGWCPVLGSRYGISFSKGLFIKIVFRRAKLKKLHHRRSRLHFIASIGRSCGGLSSRMFMPVFAPFPDPDLAPSLNDHIRVNKGTFDRNQMKTKIDRITYQNPN